MNRPLTSVGFLLAIFGAFFFYGVFVGITPGFTAFMLALVLVPIGSGILFYGAAYKGSYSAQPRAMGGGGGPTSGTVWAALGVAVVAILLAVAALSIAFTAQTSAGNVSTQVSQVNNGLASLNSTVSTLGVQPGTVPVKIDWCNSDPTSQDRYCPSEFVVVQGDVVQLMFIHNDTDAHTFTLESSPYFFQINGTGIGMRNFINNASYTADCSNSGTYAQESVPNTVSPVYCVSGGSLMAPSGHFNIAQNSNPANPGQQNGIPLVEVPIDNQVHIQVNDENAGIVELYGIGSFQATTPGVYEFFCHYHVSNGMFGYMIVLPNAYCNTNPTACGIKS